MSTSAPTRARLGPRFRLPPAEAVLTRRMLREMWKITRWFWPVAAVVAAGVGVVIAQFSPLTKSIWENAGQWPRWWLFAMSIAVVTTYLPIVVTHGVTRRAGLRALAASGVLISLSWAGFMVSGHVVEQVVYDRLGWPDTLDTPHLFADGFDVLPMLAEYWLIFTAYLVTGALIGGLYYRFGAIRGTLLLVPAALPAVAIEVLLSTGWYGAGLQDGLSVTRPTAAVLVVASIVVLSLAALGIHLVLRDVPIHSRK